MSNKTATMKVSLTYVGPGQDTIRAPDLSQTVLYTALSEGIIDVPVSTASATSYALPMGSIGIACTGGVIENRTGQGLHLLINTNFTSAYIASGGIYVFGDPNSSSLPVTAITLKTTATQSATVPGEIGYRLFGDPV